MCKSEKYLKSGAESRMRWFGTVNPEWHAKLTAYITHLEAKAERSWNAAREAVNDADGWSRQRYRFFSDWDEASIEKFVEESHERGNREQGGE